MNSTAIQYPSQANAGIYPVPGKSPATQYEKAKTRVVALNQHSGPDNEDVLLSCISGHRKPSIYETKMQLEIFFNDHKEIGVLVDDNFNILLSNVTAARFVKEREGKIPRGKSFFDYCNPSQHNFFSKCFLAALTGRNVEKQICQTSGCGRDTYWRMKFAPAKDKTSKIFGVIFIAEDVTQCKLQQLKIAKQITQLKNIAWKQSHIMRSPLANLKGLVTLLEQDPNDKLIMRFITQELSRLDSIIIDMVNEASSTYTDAETQ